jgi:hypothetical protein
MNTDDREYMATRVLVRSRERKGEPIKRFHSHRLIDAAARIAADRVERIMANSDTDTGKVDALNNWVEFIEHRAVAVMLTPPNSARAYQMFKTLNDRAQKTTQADMIKNHLFEHAEDKVDEAQSKWSTMRTSIEGVVHAADVDPLLTYLHHVSIVFYGPITSDDIFEKMEQDVVSRSQSLQFLEALASHANDYAAIVSPTHPKWGLYQQQVRIYVDQISQELRMSFIRPLMLAIAARFNPSETQKAFRLLVSWVVRFLIAGGSRSGKTEAAIGEAAHKIRTGEITTTKGVVDAVENAVPNDIKFQEAFSKKTLAATKQARFILAELEAQARGGKPDELLEVVSDTSTVSLEHILPKNPTAPGWGHFTADQRGTYCNRLGNLLLMKAKDNGAINDKPFPQKREAYKKSSHLVLTRDVVTRTESASEWTIELIEKRQKYMAELAVQRWPRKLK